MIRATDSKIVPPPRDLATLLGRPPGG